jgi:hypothetical protein
MLAGLTPRVPGAAQRLIRCSHMRPRRPMSAEKETAAKAHFQYALKRRIAEQGD